MTWPPTVLTIGTCAHVDLSLYLATLSGGGVVVAVAVTTAHCPCCVDLTGVGMLVFSCMVVLASLSTSRSRHNLVIRDSTLTHFRAGK